MSQPRVTIRCLQVDLRMDLPPLDEELAPEHELFRRLVEYAPTAPQGLEAIRNIPGRRVHKLKTARWRGAAWVEEARELFWLLAGALRSAGNREDAYEHFGRLHESGSLWPGADDYARLRGEVATAFCRVAPPDVARALAAARSRCGDEVDVDVANTIPLRLFVCRDDELEEIWAAVRLEDTEGTPVDFNVATFVLAAVEEAAGSGQWQWEHRRDWRGEPLPHFLVVKYGLGSL